MIPEDAIDSLLQNALSRAVSTLSKKKSFDDSLDNLTETSCPQNMVDTEMNTSITDPLDHPPKDKRNYLDNPSVTPTALAHSLWSQVIRPYQDITIDATAGNGKDSLILAQFLFPPKQKDHPQDNHPSLHAHAYSSPQLICIDIQRKACENTMQLLNQYVSKDIMEHNIRVLHQSHAPMPSLSPSSVGLICYNLGYLPGMDDKTTCQTQMVTTLFSLTDSTLLLRQGGLLSVMTYPGNGWKEYCAVKYFFEGLALFTSKRCDWRDFVDMIPNDHELQRQHEGMYETQKNATRKDNDPQDKNMETQPWNGQTDSIRQSVKMGLERIKEQGYEKQTWRVFDHRPLGRPLSPILFTAMRIK